MSGAPSAIRHAAFSGLIGVARRDITPPVGIYARMWGAAMHEVAEGIHRPLCVTALALREHAHSVPQLILAIDTGWWRSTADEALVRGGVLAALCIPAEALLMNCSHTHAGPSIARADANRPGGGVVADYLRSMRDAAIAACVDALASAAPATLSWDRGECALAHNRDLRDPGRARYLLGCNPGEPADRTLLVGRATTATGVPLATIVNYACHPTTLAYDNRLISPDFVGAMRETVESNTASAPCLFLQGASGDLAPRRQYSGDTALADANGRQLGFAVLAVLAGMLSPGCRLAYAGAVESGAPLATWREEAEPTSTMLCARRIDVPLPLKELPSLADIDAQMAACTEPVLGERLRRRRAVRQVVGEGTETVSTVWVWRLGDAVLIAHRDEAYSRLQVDLRAGFSDAAIVVMNLTNGAPAGYLPPAELYGRDMYQIWQTPYADAALGRFTAACLAAVGDVLAETAAVAAAAAT